MTIGIYSMKDLKVGYGPVFPEQNDNTAKRLFGTQMNAANSIQSFSPADFQLFKLGEYDTESGIITPCEPILLLDGYNVVKEK